MNAISVIASTTAGRKNRRLNGTAAIDTAMLASRVDSRVTGPVSADLPSPGVALGSSSVLSGIAREDTAMMATWVAWLR
jgi:hypothetical protein